MPAVSVIIPSYNYANYVAECIQSVLDQTFTDFEVIVVDDGSKDHTAEVIKHFTDPRVKYIYQENRGLPGARNTGIRASSGEILAFLDSDDKYHPSKLEIQVAFLEQHPEVGLVYNSRFLVDSAGQLLMLRRAPTTIELADLVTGYPFAPSDVVMRREWAFRVGLFDESFVLNSEDLNFHIRLMLAGCQFAGVPEVLAYRQIHTGRVFGNIAGKLPTYLRALDTAFTDPRCPPEVLALRDLAYADHYLSWGYQAAVQEETELAQQYLREAVRLNPKLLGNEAEEILHFLAHASTRDGGDHETALRQFFDTLPGELSWLSNLSEFTIARGYMLRGIQSMVWRDPVEGAVYLSQAVKHEARLDESFLKLLSDQLFSYEMTFGEEAADHVLRQLMPHLRNLGTPATVRHLQSTYIVNQAFKNYHVGNYTKVVRQIGRLMVNDPKHLANRGALSIMLRSAWLSARTS